MAKTKKFYVVWNGRINGVYKNWDSCKQQIDGFEGAQYKSFLSLEEAEVAFTKTYAAYKGIVSKPVIDKDLLAKVGNPLKNSIAVDAACSGNPGLMEYRGVVTDSKKQLFIQGPFEHGTNNIGEFLALVHGLAYLQKHQKFTTPIYSDSKIAIGWVKDKQCRTKVLPVNIQLKEMILRAEDWLRNNSYKNPILKWETKVWGEIPADFGRKK